MKNSKFCQLDLVNARFIFDKKSELVFVFAKDKELAKVTPSNKSYETMTVIAKNVFGVEPENCIYGIIDISKDQCITSAHSALNNANVVPTDSEVSKVDKAVNLLLSNELFSVVSGKSVDLLTGKILSDDTIPLFIMPKGQNYLKPNNGFLVHYYEYTIGLRNQVRGLVKLTSYFSRG